MKKTFLLLALGATTFALAQSTETKGSPISFGVKAGGNYTLLNASHAIDNKFAYYVGGFAKVKLSDKLFLQPEIVYSLEGGKTNGIYYSVGANGQDYKINHERVNLNYINVPIMLQYKATDKFYLEAGPQFGFLLNAKYKRDIDGKGNTTDVSDNFKAFNFGVAIGAGYQITPQLGINARYTHGLTDIVKNNHPEIDGKTRSLQLGLSYSFK